MLEYEETKEHHLPRMFFGVDTVLHRDTRYCMLCSETFGRIKIIFKRHCKRCGKAVCHNCSNQKRRLCQIEGKKRRVCDECDALMDNHVLEGTNESAVQHNKQMYDDQVT